MIDFLRHFFCFIIFLLWITSLKICKMSNGRTTLQAKIWQNWGESCDVVCKMWCMFPVWGTTGRHNMMEKRAPKERWSKRACKNQTLTEGTIWSDFKASLWDSADITVCHILLKIWTLKGLLPARHVHLNRRD